MTIATAPTVYIENASLQYDGEVLFEKLNCTLPASKITCLLGQSGIGKSSLLRQIAGLHKQGKTAKITGKIYASDHKPLHSRVAYMAQTDLLMPWLSVLDNVLIGYRLRGQTLPVAAAQELLNAVGLTKAQAKFPAQLSGGMRQRAALTRTLLEEHPVVLMDEPFSALDTVTRLRIQELAAKLLVNRTVLLVTHDPLEALRLGHQILIMSGKPAVLDDSLQLPGNPPRDVTDPEVLHWQGKIMAQLIKNQQTEVL